MGPIIKNKLYSGLLQDTKNRIIEEINQWIKDKGEENGILSITPVVVTIDDADGSPLKKLINNVKTGNVIYIDLFSDFIPMQKLTNEDLVKVLKSIEDEV